MAVFGGMTLTNKGLVLQGKAQAGGKLNYTRIAVGDGSLTGQAVPAMNGLISQKISLPITRITTQPPNKAIIGSVLRNADVSTGFYWREVGVFAQDPDAGEILYAYANAGVTADYIPPGGGSDIIEKTFDCVVVVGTAANITAVIDESLVFAKKSELNNVEAAKVDKVSGKGLSANDYTTAEKTKLAGITAGAGGGSSATDTVIGSRTISDTTAPTGDSGTITNLLGWLANTVKSITGKSSWRTAPATTLEAAKAHADDATRHLTAADRTAIAGAIPSSQRNVANGVAALDNASLVVGQGLRLGGSEQYIEKVFSFQTVNGTANQKIDYTFGPAVMSGFIEVTVTGAWGNSSSEGRLTKRMDVMGSTAGTINRQSSQYTEVSGAIRGQLSISDVYWKEGKWTVTVEARTSAGNNYTTHVKHHGPLGAKDWVQGSIYTGSPTTLPIAVQVISDDTKTKSGQQIETVIGSQSKADAAQAAAIAYTDTKVGRVDLTQTLGPGTSIIQADQNGSELDLTVQGVTRNNVLAIYGDAESLAGWTQSSGEPVILSSTQKRSGSYSFKAVPNASKGSYVYRDFTTSLEATKQYVLAFAVFVETYTNGNQEVSLRDIGTFTPKYNVYLGASVPVGSWQTYYLKIPPGNTLVGNGFRLLVGAGGAMVNYMYFDDIRMYEVTAAEYAAIGATITGAAIDSYFPHVSGKQHVQGVSVTKQGKNAASVSVLSMTNTVNGATLIEDRSTNSITVNSGTVAGYNYAATSRIQVIPNTVYTLSAILTNVSGPDLPSLSVRKGSDNGVSNITGLGGVGSKSFSFNSGAETEIILFAYGSVATAAVQTKRYENIQLELGSAATSFTPAEPQSVILPVTLGQIGDVRDSVYSQGTEWMYVERIKKGIVLDGALAWTYGGGYPGFHRAMHTNYPNAVILSGLYTKYDGFTSQFKETSASDDCANIYPTNGGSLYLSLPHSKTGWSDSINPSNNAIKALMNGWKATANDGSAYSSWVAILDGSAPATNTSTYVAANKAPGWTAWATLDYVLASAAAPVPIPNAEGSITLHPGGNQINIETGVIQREKVTPVFNSGANYWEINRSDSPYVASKTSKRCGKFVEVYAGSEAIPRVWAVNAIGVVGTDNGVRMGIPVAYYDPSATYYVTYIALDKYALTANVTETAATWRTGLGGAVSDVLQAVAEIRQNNDLQDFADDYIEAKVDNLKLGVANGSALPATIQKYKLTEDGGWATRYTGTLNNLTTPGYYYIPSTPSDAPIGYTDSGILEVIRLADSTTNTIQRLTTYGAGRRTFTRGGGNGGIWGAWQETVMKATQLANTMDLNTLTEGEYYAVSNASAATHINMPAEVAGVSYALKVLRNVGDGVTQLLTTYLVSSPRMFVRSNYNGLYGAWYEIETTRTKNVAGGYAGLDTNGDILLTAVPDAVQKYSLTKDDGKALVLAGGTDLNTVLTTGFYSAQSLVNAPGDSSAWFHIIVQTHSGNTDGTSYVVQRAINLTSAGTPPEWIRRRVANVWGAWVNIPNSSMYNVANGLAFLDANGDLSLNTIPDAIIQGTVAYAVTTGTVPNLYVQISSFSTTALVTGIRLSIKIHVATSGPITLNVNGLGAKSIKKPNGNNPPLVQGGVYTVVYDGTAFILQGEGGEYGTAEAAQVLTGYSVGREYGVVDGSMPNRSTENHHMPASQYTVWEGDRVFLNPPEGYYNGSSWVTAPATDIRPENILVGKNILGVSGNGKSPMKEAVRTFKSNGGTVSVSFEGLPFVPMLLICSQNVVCTNSSVPGTSGLTEGYGFAVRNTVSGTARGGALRTAYTPVSGGSSYSQFGSFNVTWTDNSVTITMFDNGSVGNKVAFIYGI